LQLSKQEGLKLVQAMHNRDLVLDRPITLAFEISIPFNVIGPDVGPHKKNCRFTATAEERALIVETIYDREPVYHQPGAGGTDRTDFDSNGNLLVARSLRKEAFSSAHMNILSDEQERLCISPDGEVLDRTRHLSVYHFDIGNPDGFYELEQCWLGAGRGFARHVRDVQSHESVDSTRRRIIANGSYGDAFAGQWKLLIEQTENSTIARQAEFFVEDNSTPVLKVKTSGLIAEGSIELASEGWVSYPSPDRDYTLDVRVVETRERADSRQVSELRDSLSGPFPAHVTVIDRREQRDTSTGLEKRY
jgi:hypothetical protein